MMIVAIAHTTSRHTTSTTGTTTAVLIVAPAVMVVAVGMVTIVVTVCDSTVTVDSDWQGVMCSVLMYGPVHLSILNNPFVKFSIVWTDPCIKCFVSCQEKPIDERRFRCCYNDNFEKVCNWVWHASHCPVSFFVLAAKWLRYLLSYRDSL